VGSSSTATTVSCGIEVDLPYGMDIEGYIRLKAEEQGVSARKRMDLIWCEDCKQVRSIGHVHYHVEAEDKKKRSEASVAWWGDALFTLDVRLIVGVCDGKVQEEFTRMEWQAAYMDCGADSKRQQRRLAEEFEECYWLYEDFRIEVARHIAGELGVWIVKHTGPVNTAPIRQFRNAKPIYHDALRKRQLGSQRAADSGGVHQNDQLL